MISRVIRASVMVVLTAGLLSLPPSVVQADEPPDTTAPQVDLNPCRGTETSCRRVFAEVYGDLQPGDDLAVLGARIGDVVLAEHVFDDGTGFEPYGHFAPYGSDVVLDVDYGLKVEVPRGTHDITIYARDLAGNTSELTTTVLGPVPPDPVKGLRAELSGPRQVWVSWRQPDLHSSCCADYVVTTARRRPKSRFSFPMRTRIQPVIYDRLSSGWHRFTVRASTVGGTGPARSVRVFVPRRHRA